MTLTPQLPDLSPETEDLLTPIGFTLDGAPIWPVFGSERDVESEEDDDDDDSDDEEDDDTIKTGAEGGDEDEDGKKKSEKEWKPPTKEEWERTQNALKRANSQARKRRTEAKKKEAGTDDATKKAAEEAERKYKPVAVRSAAKAAFLEAGLNDASDGRLTKLMRMIDLDEVDVDDDGDVLGLEDQIDSIKDDYPELFGKKAEPKKRATKLDASGRSSGGDGGGKPKSSADRIAAGVLGSK